MENSKFEPLPPVKTDKSKFWKSFGFIYGLALVSFFCFVLIMSRTMDAAFRLPILIIIIIYLVFGLILGIVLAIRGPKKIIYRITLPILAILFSYGIYFLNITVSIQWHTTTFTCTNSAQCHPIENDNGPGFTCTNKSISNTFKTNNQSILMSIITAPVDALTVDSNIGTPFGLGYPINCRCNIIKKVCEWANDCNPFIKCL